MGENGEDGPKYLFTTENDETKTTSRDYTGRAVAQYPNGDVYEGYYVEGVRDGFGIYRYA
jgi:radial spoke head protein 1